MTTLSPNWSPSSRQLELAFRYRKSPTALFVRSRMFSSSGYRRLRVLRVAGDEAEKSTLRQERRRSDDSGTGSGSATGALSDSSGSGQSDSSKSTEGVGGFIGAGLAGVFLVAGLSFAALAFSKKASSRRMQEMEPLTNQHEVLLTSDEETLSKKENVEEEGNTAASYLESKNDMEDQSPLSPKSTIDTLESSQVANDMSTPSGNDKFASNGTLQFLEEQNAVGFADVPSNTDSPSMLAVGTSEQVSEHVDMISIPLSSLDVRQGTVEASLENYLSPEVELSSNYIPDNLAEDQSKDSSAGYEYGNLESKMISDIDPSLSRNNLPEPIKEPGIPAEENHSFIESEWVSVNAELELPRSSVNTVEGSHQIDVNKNVVTESHSSGNSVASIGMPAPSLLPAALMTPPGKVLVPATVDQAHGQTFAALQVQKVIEVDAQPSELCTRREYARWLVSASSVLSRNTISKVYPAMHIENITELAFDDITPEDPDFSSIQGLAEAGLISSKLSRQDMLSSPDTDTSPLYFFPDSPLSRQDLVTWKMALEKRQLPDTNKEMLQQVSGFIDIDRIDPNAWPALLADVSSGEQGIIAQSLGYTRLFQPDKPVTKGQAAIALGNGEAAYIVNEELARIEAESVAENAVAAHIALVAEVEKDINANFEKDLLIERETIEAVEKMAEEARQELERLREEREKDNTTLLKERTAIESEMKVFSRLRQEVEGQLESLLSKKAEISYEKDRIDNLRKETEDQNRAIARLQYELEVERKAMSMARAWAEEEAKRARESAKALEEARDRFSKRGLKITIDDDLHKESPEESTRFNSNKPISVNEVTNRAENLLDKLKQMTSQVGGKSREVINTIISRITALLSALKDCAAKVGQQAMEFKQNAAGFTATIQEGVKRVAGDCRDGVEKITQKFRA